MSNQAFLDEYHINQLWEVYLQESESNEQLPEAFSEKFWTAYQNLIRTHSTYISTTTPTVSFSGLKPEDEILSIFYKYWSKTQKAEKNIYIKKMKKDNTANLVLGGCVGIFGIGLLGIASFILAFAGFFKALLITIPGIFVLLMFQKVFGKDDNPTNAPVYYYDYDRPPQSVITITFAHDHLNIHEKKSWNKEHSQQILYQNIHKVTTDNEGLLITGQEEGSHKELRVLNEMFDFFKLTQFLDDIVACNRQRR